MNRRFRSDEEGGIPFVLVGIALLGGGAIGGAAWAGHGWAQRLVGVAGGELTAWVLKAAFWALDLIALQAASTPIHRDWYTPVLEGPALPIFALAALVMVATLIAETIAGLVTGNTPRIVQAVGRALIAGMLATVAGSLLLAVGGALSDLGRIALQTSGAGVDAPLVPLQQVLMDTAEQRDHGVELFIAFVAGLVIVFTSLAIYFTLAMRPVLLAVLIVFLPVAHVLAVWTPMRRVQLRAWALAFAVLLAEAAVLTTFAVTNTVMGQPQGVDRLMFGTFGLLLAALSPAALARVVGTPELHTAVQSMSRGSKAVAVGAGVAAAKGALGAWHWAARRDSRPPVAYGSAGAGGALAGGAGSGGGGGDLSPGPAGGPPSKPGPAGPAAAPSGSNSRRGDGGPGGAVAGSNGTVGGRQAAGTGATGAGVRRPPNHRGGGAEDGGMADNGVAGSGGSGSRPGQPGVGAGDSAGGSALERRGSGGRGG